MKHTVKLEDLHSEDLITRTILCCSYEADRSKRLFAFIDYLHIKDTTLMVTDNMKIVYNGYDLIEALKIYNEIE